MIFSSEIYTITPNIHVITPVSFWNNSIKMLFWFYGRMVTGVILSFGIFGITTRGSPVKPGDLVANNTPGSSSKLFSSPLGLVPPGTRKYHGLLTGIGLVVDVYRSDVKVISGENIGWCYVGNLKVVE